MCMPTRRPLMSLRSLTVMQSPTFARMTSGWVSFGSAIICVLPTRASAPRSA